MQRFPCPFCGLRDEREFSFAGEAGKSRPDTTADVSDAVWTDYLNTQRNEKGRAKEIWCHLPCQEYFLMDRDTVTMKVLSTQPFRKEET